jgi:hypothetical protein
MEDSDTPPRGAAIASLAYFNAGGNDPFVLGP